MVLCMSTRETLRSRPDIPDDEVDDIVELAARLKDEDPAQARGATPQEVEQVAQELDIEPEYVQAALEQWKSDKAEAKARAAAMEAAAVDEREASSKRRKFTFWMALATIVILAMTTAAMATLGAARVNSAHYDVVTAHSQLSVVLDRQAAMAPQLVALGGGDPGTLSTLASEVSSAEDMEVRLQKSKELGLEMAKGLAAKPGSLSEADAQLRLNLQHEVTGTQNRITTEARRYRAAQDAHQRASSSLTGKLATGYGLAQGAE